MLKFTVLISSLITIGLLYLLYRFLVNQQLINSLKKAQSKLIAAERKIWGRFLFLIAIHNPSDLSDPALQEARKQLYYAPATLSFTGFTAVISEYVKLELAGTVQLGLRSELKGLTNLLEAQWLKNEQSLHNLQTKYFKFFNVGEKKIKQLVNFQKMPN